MKNRFPILRMLASVLPLALAGCDGGGGAGGGPGKPASLTLELVTTDVNFPLFLTAPPGDLQRLFIVEKTGAIRVFRDGAVLPVPFLDVQSEVSAGGEQGLLGLAFDPQYAQNRRFYVSFTDLADDVKIVRYLGSPTDPDVALPAADLVLLTVDKATSHHNGGQIAFGPDGYLYIAIGDDGDANDAAQSPNDLYGSMLRIDVSPQGGYAIPPGNPFVGVAGARPELWNVGLRNPWGFSFDRLSGDLYIGDVGADAFEEINVAPAAQGGGAGANYGWSVMEGPNCHFPAVGCGTSGLTMPAFVYPTHHAGDCAVIGGYVYRGAAIPGLHGTYFFADLCSSWVKSFRWQGGHATPVQSWPFPALSGPVTALGQDAAGELYVLTNWGGVYRIVEG